MRLAITLLVFIAESICMLPKPKVVGSVCSSPDRAGVVDHGCLANILQLADRSLVFSFASINLNFFAVNDMVCRRQKLT
jgi:hypothetical protein